jgi:glycosyltransferase involved in cell wall biosynthesis
MSNLKNSSRSALARLKRRLIELFGTSLGVLERLRSSDEDIGDGVTIVTVNWNTLPFLEALVEAVRARSPENTRLIVIDNASNDGSREFLRSQPDIDSVLLPVNVGHGRALDIGCARALTTTIALLDVDAFPISQDWLERPLAELDNGKKLSGAYFHRNFIHPCFMVFRRDLLLNITVGFSPVGRTSTGPKFGLFLDVGEAVSQAVAVEFGTSALDKIPVTERLGDGKQAVFGDAVFHNFYSTYGPGRLDATERFEFAVRRFGLSD